MKHLIGEKQYIFPAVGGLPYVLLKVHHGQNMLAEAEQNRTEQKYARNALNHHPHRNSSWLLVKFKE
ncbi:MAG: hypothetical protein ABJM26_20685 [Anderseniella sp.]